MVPRGQAAARRRQPTIDTGQSFRSFDMRLQQPAPQEQQQLRENVIMAIKD